ncbi:hypothetical protein [Massilia aquatica]|uniref:Uncharacterized protein n=1 Tax=Massilia aquatica TaxID=2609000 RepID=A0ABX0M8M1_9BURK|nr:hypothetical protein [Massilia aquatica]NHZ43528.1 hypothetical protein [Massilia aquatica]
MKRSPTTVYTYAETRIYEFKNAYFVIEECQQGQILNPAHGSQQLASDYAALSAALRTDCSAREMGAAVAKALADYDSRAHPYGEYNLKARNKAISNWVGARGIMDLEKNSRQVQLIQDLLKNSLTIFPYDNCIAQPWYGPMEDCAITLPGTASCTDIGEAVCQAFTLCTYHPERTENRGQRSSSLPA